MLTSFFSHRGVLGMNARNLLYIRPFNPKKATAFADNKLKTKAFLMARGIPAAKLYARIETRDQLLNFDFSQLPDHSVLKPNFGFGGEGIVLLKGRDKNGNFLRNGKHVMQKQELKEHIEDILDGKFSLGGRKDTAFFEEILTVHESLAPFRPVGLPDLRIIVFNLVPVMAMLRVPTAASDGKANVHLGGMGIGIDIAKGTTTHAVQYNRIIHELPHGASPKGHQIPYWDEILLISSKIQQITNIGYLAVDITLDQNMGPAVLEVNARAGLMVQVANLAPLRARLERVKGIKVSSPEKGVRIGQDLFGNKVNSKEKTEQQKVTKPVLGLKEHITIVGDGTSFQQTALIDPLAERSLISEELLETLLPLLEKEEGKKNMYRAKLQIGGTKVQTVLEITKKKMEYPMKIGRRDIASFLIDPNKKLVTVPDTVKRVEVKSNLKAVDKRFAAIDKDLLLLKHLKPINLKEELVRCNADESYNPVFNYAPLPFDPLEFKERLLQESIDDSALGVLLEKKRTEMLVKIELLQARGVDAEAFTASSFDLFGKPSSSLIRSAQAHIFNRKACDLPVPEKNLLSAEQVKVRFEQVIEQYGLHNWKVVLRDSMVADVTVGGSSVYLRSGAKFSPVRVDALIAHEIETHVLSSENGNNQPYELLRRGFANYIETQEGLATYNQNRVYGSYNAKYYSAAKNVLGLKYGLEHSFAETRRYFKQDLHYSEEKSLSQTITIKRGLSDTSASGGFTKGLVYFRGNKAIEKFIENGGKLESLYVGKIALEDLSLVQSIPDLQSPLLLPTWLRTK